MVNGALLTRVTDAQSSTPTPTPSRTPTATPTPFDFFPEPTAVTPNAQCPSGTWSPDGLEPAWAAACGYCVPPVPVTVETPIFPSDDLPTFQIPTSNFGEPTNTPVQLPTLTPTSITATPTPSQTPTITPTFTATPVCVSRGDVGYAACGGAYSGATQGNNGSNCGYFLGTAYGQSSVTLNIPDRGSQGITRLVGGVSGAAGSPQMKIEMCGVPITGSPFSFAAFNGVPLTISPAAYCDTITLTVIGGGGDVIHFIGFTVRFACPFATPTPTATGTATSTPTATSTGTITAVPSDVPPATFASDSYFNPLADCSTPEYRTSTPILIFTLGFSGTTCTMIFPGLNYDNDDISVHIHVPILNVCIDWYTPTLGIAGVTIDLQSMVVVILILTVFWWAFTR